MPEGHSVHRIARQFSLHFVGKRVAASSPQGRFASGAAQIDGRLMVDAKAVGKQMFLEFDNGLWLRVHLGMYGAWDFAGDFTADATTVSANGRMGQTNQRGTVLDSRGEDSLLSIGAPRVARLRMSEQETAAPGADVFPPEPIGAVRVRLLTDNTVADLRGPTACDVMTPDQVQATPALPDQLADHRHRQPGAQATAERDHRAVTDQGYRLSQAGSLVTGRLQAHVVLRGMRAAAARRCR